jgi:hypothetical protein
MYLQVYELPCPIHAVALFLFPLRKTESNNIHLLRSIAPISTKNKPEL